MTVLNVRWYFWPTDKGCGLDKAKQFKVTMGIFLPSPEVSQVTRGKSSGPEFLFVFEGVFPFLSLMLPTLLLLLLLLFTLLSMLLLLLLMLRLPPMLIVV